MSKGKLFIISGASGVGKSTVLKHVMAGRDDLLFSVSATTRPPRPGEVAEKDYSFISPEQFQQMVDEGAFLEYDDHNAARYGTPRVQVEEKLTRACVILDIEPKGAFAVRSQRPDATLIFITPPSMEELERRLRSRGDTSEEQIAMRLKRAQWEMEQRHEYHHQVVNDVAQRCAEEILQIIAEKADA